MRLTESAKGVFIISATPFTETGAIDYDSADSLVEFYLERGVTGMTILGMMGEAQKLEPEEARAFMSHMIDRVAGRVPIIVGVTNSEQEKLLDLSKAAMDAGAAGVMIAPVKGAGRVYRYFARTLRNLGPDVPVCFQDFPLTTGVEVAVPTLAKLVEDFPQVVMLKHEDWPGLNKIDDVRAATERRISILCGNGGTFLPEEMARGADGAMTGFAYPEMLVGVVELCQANRFDEAHDLFDAFLPIIRLETQPGGMGLAVRKEILRRRGAIASNALRQPGAVLTEADHADITRLMQRLDAKLASMGKAA